MNYLLVIGKTAQTEIDETFEYYDNIQPKLGLKFIGTLEAIFDRIVDNPLQFPQYRTPYREAYLIKFPYIVVFEVEQFEIIIFALFHTSRNPSKKFKKRK